MPGDNYSHVFADQAVPAPVMPVTCGGHVTLPAPPSLHVQSCRRWRQREGWCMKTAGAGKSSGLLLQRMKVKGGDGR